MTCHTHVMYQRRSSRLPILLPKLKIYHMFHNKYIICFILNISYVSYIICFILYVILYLCISYVMYNMNIYCSHNIFCVCVCVCVCVCLCVWLCVCVCVLSQISRRTLLSCKRCISCYLFRPFGSIPTSEGLSLPPSLPLSLPRALSPSLAFSRAPSSLVCVRVRVCARVRACVPAFKSQ